MVTMVTPFLGYTAMAYCQDEAPPTHHQDEPTPTPNPHHQRQRVVAMVNQLQQTFVNTLQRLEPNKTQNFYPVSWLRDEGLHGGGTRYQSPATSTTFKQATVNVSSVHFDDVVKYPIDSATALSVIIHPTHPFAPSMHFHISFMEPRHGKAYWRLIADLNPTHPTVEDEQTFANALSNVKHVSKELYLDAQEFGNKYFYIPSLGRHRGTCHFFVGKLEEDELGFDDSCALARALAETALTTYETLVEKARANHPIADVSVGERELQIAYHTLYVYQVLTLDRGTTHGLMAHNQNDVGTLGSLPPVIDPALLRHWMEQRTLGPQKELLAQVLAIVPEDGTINDSTRGQLAEVVRTHYRSSAEARKHQANLDLNWWKERTTLRVMNGGGKRPSVE